MTTAYLARAVPGLVATLAALCVVTGCSDSTPNSRSATQVSGLPNHSLGDTASSESSACDLLSDEEAAEAMDGAGGYSHFEVPDPTGNFPGQSLCQYQRGSAPALFITITTETGLDFWNGTCTESDDGYGNAPVALDIGDASCYMIDDGYIRIRVGSNTIKVWASVDGSDDAPAQRLVNVATTIAGNYGK